MPKCPHARMHTAARGSPANMRYGTPINHQSHIIVRDDKIWSHQQGPSGSSMFAGYTSVWHTTGVCHSRLAAQAALRAAQRAPQPRTSGSRLSAVILSPWRESLTPVGPVHRRCGHSHLLSYLRCHATPYLTRHQKHPLGPSARPGRQSNPKNTSDTPKKWILFSPRSSDTCSPVNNAAAPTDLRHAVLR